MSTPKSKERPEELLLRLMNDFLRMAIQLLSSIAIGFIVVGKYMFDSLHRTFVEPCQLKKRKMQEEPHFRQDLPHDQSE